LVSKLEQGINITQVNVGRGAKLTILEDKKHRIIRAVRRKPTATSTRKLGAKYGISTSSVHQVLTEKNTLIAKQVAKFH